ncbi:nuclear transport factor 2 family protein [Methylobacterium currus]|uniref:Nuclear transport factor 2 family protein n=1 Tax=Methylobacterium currus TaxID=2051553 RepID=A0A2R4WL89_9HYPH|nr:nuclear transport factor 2 family protein [Methylobacterium currus]AWB22276.1 nuclear transport factor 2 family protein [Methylobacterium currus]UHC18081.1 nuclear transport factor 2 family protein [Methylobacterium currus]
MSETTQTDGPAPDPDYDRLLRANLERVFNERDPGKRAAALDELFVAEPVMFEPTNVVAGRSAIAAVAGTLLAQFGPTFRFTPVGPAVGHHGLAWLPWQAGPEGGPVAVTGADVAEVVEGRIARLWVLLNPPAS